MSRTSPVPRDPRNRAVAAVVLAGVLVVLVLVHRHAQDNAQNSNATGRTVDEATTAPRLPAGPGTAQNPTPRPLTSPGPTPPDSPPPPPAAPNAAPTPPSAQPALPVPRHGQLPPVVGLNLQDAWDVTRAAGYHFVQPHDAADRDRYQILYSNWRVCDQQPAPGEATAETRVRFGVVRTGERCPTTAPTAPLPGAG